MGDERVVDNLDTHGGTLVEKSAISGVEQTPGPWLDLGVVQGWSSVGRTSPSTRALRHLRKDVAMSEWAPGDTPDEAKLIARQEWPDTEADTDYAALGYDDEKSRHFRWKTWQAIEGLWALEDPATVDVAATERDIEADLAGVPFRGIVDRLEREGDGLVVTDYKSGKAPSPRFRRPRLDQVLLYAAAVEADTGEMPVRARLLYLGQRPVGIDVTRKEIDVVTEKLAATWASINTACETDEFEPRTGPLCGWCPYVDLCPEGTKAVEKRNQAQGAEDAAYAAAAAASA